MIWQYQYNNKKQKTKKKANGNSMEPNKVFRVSLNGFVFNRIVP